MNENEVIQKPLRNRALTLKSGLAIVLLILFSFLIVTYHLQSNPPGFFIDESIYGFEAYTLLKTGGFSSSGEFLPRLFASADAPRSHGLYTYLVVPFVGLLGLNEFSVRLATVFSSVLLLCVLFLLLRNRVSTWSVLLALLWWPLTSWVFLLSRVGMELLPTALLSAVLMWILIEIHDSEEVRDLHIFLFDVGLITLFFTYTAGKVLALGYLVFALAVLLCKRAPLKALLKVLAALGAILLLSLPYLLDGSFIYRANELSTKCTDGIFHCVARNIASHFDYRSYFADSYSPSDFKTPTHSIMGTSLIPRPLSVFLLAGLLVCLYRLTKRDFFASLVLGFLVVGIIPASLTIRGFDSYRSVSLLPIAFILIALGLDACLRLLGKLPFKLEVFSILLFLAGTVYFGSQEMRVLMDYEYKSVIAEYWHYGYRQVFDYFLEHYEEYDEFVVTETIAYVPDLYIRFYDPQGDYTKIRVGTLSSIDRNSRALFAASSDELDLTHFTLHKPIFYPNGRSIKYLIGEPLPTEDGR